MKKTVLLLVIISVLQDVQAQVLDWAGAIGSSGRDFIQSIYVDPSNGTSYITGYYSSANIDIDPSSANWSVPHKGGRDMFIAAILSNGTLDWVSVYGDTGDDVGIKIKASNDGNLLVCGYFKGTVQFDPLDGSDPASLLTSGNNGNAHNGFILKLNKGGQYIWVKEFVENTSGLIAVNDVLEDNAGNIYSIGTFMGSADFDPGTNTTTTQSGIATTQDGFILKLNDAGNLLWIKTAGSNNTHSALFRSIEIDSNGDLWVAGRCSDQIYYDYAQGNTNHLISAVGSYDGLILKVDTVNGGLLWNRVVGGVVEDNIGDLVIDDSDNIYITGSYHSGAFFNGQTQGVYDIFQSQRLNGFVAKYKPDGKFLWVKGFGSTNNAHDDAATAITIGPDKQLYFTGYFSYGEMDADPDANSTVLLQHNYSVGRGVFIIGLDTAGTYQSSHAVGQFSNSGIIPLDLTFGGNGDLHCIGGFNNRSNDFDPGSAILTLPYRGDYDSFHMKLNTGVISSNTLQEQTQTYAYPNPFSNELRLSNAAISSVRLYNSLGKLIFKSEKTGVINTTDLASGLYLVELELMDGRIIHQKVQK